MPIEKTAFHTDYSTESFELFGDIKTNIMNADDTYFRESQIAYEWASLMRTLLTNLIQVEQSESTRKALNEALDDGTAKLSIDLEKLEEKSQSISSLKSKAQKLKLLLSIQYRKESVHLMAKLKEMREMAEKRPHGMCPINVVPQIVAKMQAIKKSYDDLTQKIDENVQIIDQTKTKLRDEAQSIENLKSKIVPIKMLLNSNSGSPDDLMKSAQDLIVECDKYHARHNHIVNQN